LVSNPNTAPKVGVLALQGDYAAHARSFTAAGAQVSEVRTHEQLQQVDGLVIPGGESTTMLKLIDYEGLWDSLLSFGQTKSIFGTCAGVILLAGEVTSPAQKSFGLMDLSVERNGYGRQLDSRIVKLDVEGHPAEAVFIRAPIIRRAGPQVKVLATYLDTPVLVEQGRHLAATFHPELTSDLTVAHRFLAKLKA
jgi:pyridoxal 5'-phosphate synthase pdxT subunit